MPVPARLIRARRPRTRVRHARLLVGATALVLATACGSGADGARSEGPAPSASGASEPAGGGTSGTDEAGSGGDRDAGLKYAACMRENNVDAPDPDAQSGLVKLPSDVPQSQIERAEKICGRNPTGQALSTGGDDEIRNDPRVQALWLKYMNCMRKNGFKEPTPDAQGNVAIVSTPEMRAAMKACRVESKRHEDLIKKLKEQSSQ
ncbi:hypothetical protein AB0D40_38850 [Streptomyces massasporeus]|uniref:hypothetical protein n=1 Tax=Streptomyces massasporeus TaxID=67324 RepID=UPI0033FFDFC4